MFTTETADRFKRLVKDNNEYYWDKPNIDEIQRSLFGYAEKYIRIVPRWISLNAAFIEATQLLEEQKEEINRLTIEVDELRNSLNKEINP